MKDELLRLAAICEQAEGPDRELDVAIARVMRTTVWLRNDEDTANYETTHWRYTASIDAALTLAKDVGVLFTLSDIKGGGRPMCVIVSTETAALFEAVADTMPLAICAAALKARRTALENTNGN